MNVVSVIIGGAIDPQHRPTNFKGREILNSIVFSTTLRLRDLTHELKS